MEHRADFTERTTFVCRKEDLEEQILSLAKKILSDTGENSYCFFLQKGEVFSCKMISFDSSSSVEKFFREYYPEIKSLFPKMDYRAGSLLDSSDYNGTQESDYQ